MVFLSPHPHYPYPSLSSPRPATPRQTPLGLPPWTSGPWCPEVLPVSILGAGLRCLLLIGSARRSVGQARAATVVPGDWIGGTFWDTCAASNGCGLRGGSNPLVGGALKDTSCVCRAGRSESFCCFISWGTSMDDRNGLRGRAPRV